MDFLCACGRKGYEVLWQAGRRPAAFCFGLGYAASAFLCELVCDGKAEKQHHTDNLDRGERLAEQQYRYEHRHDGVEIAQQRRLLPRQRADGGKVDAVRHPGVHEADDEQVDPAGRRQHLRVKARREPDIRREHDHGREQLHECALEPGDAVNVLVEQDDGGVKHRSAQGADDAAQVRPAALQAARADDERDAECRHEKAEHLRARHFLVKQQRTQRCDDHGRDIVAERGEGDGRVFIRLEQEHRVKAHRCAREQQQPECLADLTQTRPLTPDEKKQQQEHGREHRAVERKLGRGDLDPAHERAERAEHGRGHDHCQPCAGDRRRSGGCFHKCLRGKN